MSARTSVVSNRRAVIATHNLGKGAETDFLVRQPSAYEELVQVCAHASSPPTIDREIKAMTAAGAEHPKAARGLLVLDRDQTGRMTAPGVVVQPVSEWLLEGTPLLQQLP